MSNTVVDKFLSSSNFEAFVSGSHRERQMQPSAVNYGMHIGTVYCVGTVAAHKVTPNLM